ncbi:unnamed protein product [Effrenium voratum]|nr:unnamed protein product [Effrenium voratum]
MPRAPAFMGSKMATNGPRFSGSNGTVLKTNLKSKRPAPGTATKLPKGGLVAAALQWRSSTGAMQRWGAPQNPVQQRAWQQRVLMVDSDSENFENFESPEAPSPSPSPGFVRRTPPPLSPLPASGLHQRDEDYSLHFDTFFPRLRHWEERLLQQPPGLDGVPLIEGPKGVLRRDLVNRLVLTHFRYMSSPMTLFLAVAIMDECLMLRQPNLRPMLLSSVALLIAAKFEEELSPDATAASIAEAQGEEMATQDELVQAEKRVLEAIDFQLHRPTAVHHQHWLVEYLDTHSSLGTNKEELQHASAYLNELALLCAPVGRWAPSVHAAAATMVAGVLLGRPCEEPLKPLWEERRWHQLRVAMRQLLAILAEPEVVNSSIYQKYSASEYGYTSIKVNNWLTEKLG